MMDNIFKLRCDICRSAGKLYLYERTPLIFSLCKPCISTQLELEIHIKRDFEEKIRKIADSLEIHLNEDWEPLLKAIAEGRITKDNFRDYLNGRDI
jgi:hypothetical protein